MPVLNDYTRETLADYMFGVLQDTATVLTWTNITVPGSDYDEIITAVESQLLVADVADATDRRLVELHANVEVWRAVCAQEVSAYHIEGLQAVLSREQVFTHARIMFLQALDDLQAYLDELKKLEEGRLADNLYSTMIPVRAVW